MSSNNPPDVILELTHEQATFMLENCHANRRLGLAMIMAIGAEKISMEEKREKAKVYIELNDKFGDLMKLLRKAGARETDDE
jgi:translation initiation factor 2 alpha subunit (eIF-2alpha)